MRWLISEVILKLLSKLWKVAYCFEKHCRQWLIQKISLKVRKWMCAIIIQMISHHMVKQHHMFSKLQTSLRLAQTQSIMSFVTKAVVLHRWRYEIHEILHVCEFTSSPFRVCYYYVFKDGDALSSRRCKPSLEKSNAFIIVFVKVFEIEKYVDLGKWIFSALILSRGTQWIASGGKVAMYMVSYSTGVMCASTSSVMRHTAPASLNSDLTDIIWLSYAW